MTLRWRYLVVIIALAVAILTTMNITRVYKPKTLRFDGNNLLLSPAEMRQLLYNEGTPLNVLDGRYTNMIRSRMTRPDPLKPLNLAATRRQKQHFSEVRNPIVRLPVKLILHFERRTYHLKLVTWLSKTPWSYWNANKTTLIGYTLAMRTLITLT